MQANLRTILTEALVEDYNGEADPYKPAIETIDRFFTSRDPSETCFSKEVKAACKLCRNALRLNLLRKPNTQEFSQRLWNHLKNAPLERMIEAGKLIGMDDSYKKLYRLTEWVVREHLKDIDKAIPIAAKLLFPKDEKTRIPVDIVVATKTTAIAILHFPYIKKFLKKETKNKFYELAKRCSSVDSERMEKEKKDPHYFALLMIFQQFQGSFEDRKKWKRACKAELEALNKWDREDTKMITRQKKEEFEDEWFPIVIEEEPSLDTTEAELLPVKASPTLVEKEIFELKTAQEKVISDFLKAVGQDYLSIWLEKLSTLLMKELKDEELCERLASALEVSTQESLKSALGTFSPFLINSYPLMFKGYSKKLLIPTIDFLLENLKVQRQLFLNWVTETLPFYFFKSPEKLTAEKKGMILALFSGVQNFFHDLNSGMQANCSVWSGVNFDDLDPKNAKSDQLERKVIEHMNKKLKGRDYRSLFMKSYDPFIVRENILQELIDLLHLAMPGKEFPNLLLAVILRPLLDGGFNPETITLLFERIITEGMDLKEPRGPEPDPKEFEATDQKFSADLGTVYKNIFKELLVMCSNVFIKLLNSAVMYFFQETLGTVTQEKINSLLLSEVTLKPVLIAEKILYHDQEGAKVPAMIPFFSGELQPDENSKKIVQQAIEENLLYKKILQLIQDKKAKMPGLEWLENSQVENLCKNLSNTLYIILQRPLLLKMLFWHIAESIRVMKSTAKKESDYEK